jgi:hypothetical protein
MRYRSARSKAVHEAIKSLRSSVFVDRYTAKILRPVVAIAFERGAQTELHHHKREEKIK